MEYWDIYDVNKEKIGKIVKRGDYLNDDEYHIVVNAWIRNSEGKYLISQRTANKSHPLMWETTGGSIIQGEDSIQGVIREVKEELNVDLLPEQGKLIGSGTRYYKGCPDILDVYLFDVGDCKFDIQVQEEEVNDYKWASREEIKNLNDNGKFEATLFFDKIVDERC